MSRNPHIDGHAAERILDEHRRENEPSKGAAPLVGVRVALQPLAQYKTCYPRTLSPLQTKICARLSVPSNHDVFALTLVLMLESTTTASVGLRERLEIPMEKRRGFTLCWAAERERFEITATRRKEIAESTINQELLCRTPVFMPSAIASEANGQNIAISISSPRPANEALSTIFIIFGVLSKFSRNSRQVTAIK